MGHGRYIGYGFYGSYILSSLVILIMILLIFFLLYKQKKNHLFENCMKMLKERYVREEIGADEFREKKAVIEGLEVSDPILISLVERYVRGEIDSKGFFVIMNQIEK